MVVPTSAIGINAIPESFAFFGSSGSPPLLRAVLGGPAVIPVDQAQDLHPTPQARIDDVLGKRIPPSAPSLGSRVSRLAGVDGADSDHPQAGGQPAQPAAGSDADCLVS